MTGETTSTAPRAGESATTATQPEVRPLSWGPLLPEPCRRLELVLGRGRLHPWRPSAVVPLDQAAEAPLEVWCEGRLIARGEAVVVEGKLALRVTERLDGRKED